MHHNGSFTLADPGSDPYSDSDSCTIQILRERDPDLDLNQCEMFWITLCSHRVWSPNPSPSPAMWISHNGYFPLRESDTDTNSDSDSKPNGYIVLRRTFHIAWIWTRSYSPFLYRTGIRVQVCTQVRLRQCRRAIKQTWCSSIYLFNKYLRKKILRCSIRLYMYLHVNLEMTTFSTMLGTSFTSWSVADRLSSPMRNV